MPFTSPFKVSIVPLNIRVVRTKSDSKILFRPAPNGTFCSAALIFLKVTSSQIK